MNKVKIKVPFFKRWRVIRAVTHCDDMTEFFRAGSLRHPNVVCNYAVFANTQTWQLQVRLVSYVPPADMVEIYRSA